MASQQERTTKTRQIILASFRASVLAAGYDTVTIQQVVEQTNLSKGAVYHHFRSKKEIMEAIYESEAQEAIDQAIAAVPDGLSAIERLKTACLAWMRITSDRDRSRLLFDIGPTALGVGRARHLEESISLRHFNALLSEAEQAGEVQLADQTLTAILMSTIVAEATLYALKTKRPVDQMVSATIDALLMV